MKVFPVILAAVNLLTFADLSAESLTLATWNLEWFPGRNPAPSLAREAVHISQVHEDLESVAPDILLLQEIRNPEFANLAIRIIPELELSVVSNFPEQFGNGQQLAIASKIAPEETGSVTFPQLPGDPPRGFVFARFHLGNEHMLIYNIHLKSNTGGIAENIPKREAAIEHLITHYETWKRKLAKKGIVDPMVILGGDYNSDPSDPRFAAEKTTQILSTAGFDWVLGDIPPDQRVSWPGNSLYPDACLDHFFVVPGNGLRLANPEIHIGTEEASDHRAVSVQLVY